VRSLAYYPRDTYLFSGCFDSSAYVWAVGPPGKEKAKFRAVAALKNGPNSKIKAIVYCTAIRMIITGHDNGLMAFWSTTTGSVEFVLGGHAASIVELKWFPDTCVLVSGSRDGNARFWTFRDDSKSLRRSLVEERKSSDLAVSSPSVPESIAPSTLKEQEPPVPDTLRKSSTPVPVAAVSTVAPPPPPPRQSQPKKPAKPLFSDDDSDPIFG